MGNSKSQIEELNQQIRSLKEDVKRLEVRVNKQDEFYDKLINEQKHSFTNCNGRFDEIRDILIDGRLQTSSIGVGRFRSRTSSIGVYVDDMSYSNFYKTILFHLNINK